MTSEERIAESFNDYFGDSNARIGPDEVGVGSPGSVVEQPAIGGRERVDMSPTGLTPTTTVYRAASSTRPADGPMIVMPLLQTEKGGVRGVRQAQPGADRRARGADLHP